MKIIGMLFFNVVIVCILRVSIYTHIVYTINFRALPWNGILCNKSQDKIPVQILDGFEEYFQFSPRKRDFYEEQINEDCLYLNVFVPENSSLSKLPVCNNFKLVKYPNS